MFPIAIIGGVIGALVSVAKGASWLSDQLDSTKVASSAGGKADVKAPTEAQASSFQAALAAQAAGQSLPPPAAMPFATPPATTSAATPASPLALLPAQQHGPDYATLARMQAGVFAYSHIGQHRDQNPKPQQAPESLSARGP